MYMSCIYPRNIDVILRALIRNSSLPRSTLMDRVDCLGYLSAIKEASIMCVDIDWQAQRDVLSCNRYMFENHVACDVTFFVGKQIQDMKAHKFVLISRSSVFYAMLCGLLQETGPINIPDIEPAGFEQLLRYLYFEAFEPDGDTIWALLYAAKKYAVRSLVDKCVNWLIEGICADNVCNILQHAHAFDEEDLRIKCLEFIMVNGSSVLKHPSFKNLSSECVEMVISQDELWVKEEEVYDAMKEWAINECARKNIQPSSENMRLVLGGLRNLIRFSLIDGKYFADKVATDNILTSDEKVSIFRTFLSSNTFGNIEYIQIKRKSRFQEIQRVNRFLKFGDPMSIGSILHAIDFKCSNEVLLRGIIMYGAIPRESIWSGRRRQYIYSGEFVSDIEVQLQDYSNRMIATMKRHINVTEEELLELLFDEPVVLKKTWYTITLVISGPGMTRSGINGENVVSLGDGQSIEFRNSSLSSDTSVLSGQIPGLLLCRRR
ncbi:hypothetical protein ACJMK2_009083 [Sinanodonta woodiana]|uniref:BTB domain-containing protein n=1 Tax=Sinanodonta woodiana TaxID=1069815 RepID=A0ABD3VB62_SINWO